MASGEGPRLADQMNDLVVPVAELQNLPDYKLYVRTLDRGKPQEPFLVDSFAPLVKGASRSDPADVARVSLQRHGRDRRQVESSLHRFLSRASSN